MQVVFVQNIVDHVGMWLTRLDGVDLFWGKDRCAIVDWRWPKGSGNDRVVDAKTAGDLWQGRIEIVLDPRGDHLICWKVQIGDQKLVIVEVSEVIVLPTFSGIGSTE
jgi:hypothetical protein